MAIGYQQIVIVGAGEAGVAAAAALRESGYRGRLILLSAENAHPYERPPLSKEAIARDEPALTLIRPANWYVEQAVDLRLGSTAISLDRGAQRLGIAARAGLETLAYDALVLATGSAARRLHAEGALHLRDWQDARILRRRLREPGQAVVVGGGVIGLEFASTARALGWQVSVVEAMPRLMGRGMAPPLSEWFLERHREAGTAVHLGALATEIETGSEKNLVHLSGGECLEADILLAGIGAAPVTDLAVAAGCQVDDGIVVDASGRTSIAHIFAAGESTSFPHPLYGRRMRIEAWQHAGRHGAHVGRAIAGMAAVPYDLLPWFWTDQLGHNIQVAGLAAEADRTIWRSGGRGRTALHFSGERLIAATTIDNGRDIRPASRLIAGGWEGGPEALTGDPAALAAIAAGFGR